MSEIELAARHRARESDGLKKHQRLVQFLIGLKLSGLSAMRGVSSVTVNLTVNLPILSGEHTKCKSKYRAHYRAAFAPLRSPPHICGCRMSSQLPRGPSVPTGSEMLNKDMMVRRDTHSLSEPLEAV